MKTTILFILLSCFLNEKIQAQSLADVTGMPEQIIIELSSKSNKIPSQLVIKPSVLGRDSLVKGIMISTSYEKSWQIVGDLAVNYREKGLLIFVFEEHFGFNSEMNKVGVIQSRDQIDILRMMKTNGAQLNISNEKIIHKLSEWDKQFGLIIMGAGPDWVMLNLVNQPDDNRKFAKETYIFCPETVEQGARTIDALGEEIQRTGKLYLWWD